MADALRHTRGRPRKYSNPEGARLAKQKYDRERKQRLHKKPTVESDDDEPLTPPLQTTIPLRTAPKRASPPPSYTNTFRQFASPKKTPPQAPSPKRAPPPSPIPQDATFRQFAALKKTPPQAASPKRASPSSPSVNTFRQFASPKKTLPQAPSPTPSPKRKRASPPSPFAQDAFPRSASPKKSPPRTPSPKRNCPRVASPKKKTPPQAPLQKGLSTELPPSPSDQLFDDWNNTIYNDDDDDLDNYSGHAGGGSGGGHIEEGHTDEDGDGEGGYTEGDDDGDGDDDDSKGGYTKEEAYIEEGGEDIYGVSDGEQEARRLPRGNQDAQADLDHQDGLGDPEMDEELDAQDDSDSQDGLEDPEMDEEPALPSQFGHNPPLDSVGSDDSVADRLAEQLYSFHGCPSEAHDAHDDEYAQSPDSYTYISDLFRLQKPGGSIPDVLGSPKFMEKQDLNDPALLRQLYEGRGPPTEPEAEPEPKPPKKLYLPHKPSEHQNRRSKVTYDIDGLCLFPTSLAVARQGLFWQPLSHNILNIASDLHFTLPADHYITNKKTKQKRLKNGPRPLHQIVHCCLGIISGFEDLRLYAFFPRISHPNRTTTYLTNDEQRLWLNGVFLPALYAEHKGQDGVLQHFPTSYRVAQANALSHGTERTVFDHETQLSRQQLLRYFIQPEKLAGIWERVLTTIEDTPAAADFKGVTLFATAKDLKLRYMSTSLPTVYRKWKQHYKWAVEPEFQAHKQAFVDLGKQVTAEGSYLSSSAIPDGAKPQAFVYKRCCLDSFFQWYCERERPARSNRKGKGKKREDGGEEEPDNKPQKVLYANFLTKEVANMTIHFPEGSKERREGHVYTQLYSEEQAPFNVAKLTPFANEGYEHLAVDPSLANAITYAGKAAVFDRKACERGYLHSKKRANYATTDAQYKSNGTREEDRISLELLEKIQPKLVELSQRGEPMNHDYYYTIPSETLFGFLQTQINKFCLGFEHLYTQGTVVLWEKSQLMVYFLRMLRLCYGAHNLGQERELFKDRWEVKDDKGDVLEVKEGLGLQRTISSHGLGWFLPKIDWEAWNLLPTHAPQMVMKNPRIRKAYQKRWEAVGLLFEGSFLIDEARLWARRFNVTSTEDKKKLWLYYLFAINLQVFHEAIGSAIAKDLKPERQQQALNGQLSLCWDELLDASAVGRLRLVRGNNMQYKNGPAGLVDYLFDFGDARARGGWANSQYRVIYQQTLSLIEDVISKARAEEWGRQLKKLVIFTCWLLPYPSKAVLFGRTSPKGGHPSERKWFSSYYAEKSDELMGLYDSRANSDEGDDFQHLLRFTHIYCHWQTGRKGEVLCGRPLKSKMVQELQGLSAHAREQYFEKLMA
jgi:hypothetical protein